MNYFARIMFQFKQFTIHQDRCAMKVTEVACLLGALTPVDNMKRALDIGSGTGLLSLMLAQRAPGMIIDAVELDEDAFLQGKENVMASPFKERVQCIQENIFNYHPGRVYDLIICNPPFFEKQLFSHDTKKNRAWHSTEFSLQALWNHIKTLLSEKGMMSILLPAGRLKEVEVLNAANGFFLNQKITLYHRENMDTGLLVLSISGMQTPLQPQSFIIRHEQNYTDEAIQLLKEFYLKL